MIPGPKPSKACYPFLKLTLLGVGPANYYHYTLINPIIGWYVKFNSHNNYLDLLAQTGILGLACFLWLPGSRKDCLENAFQTDERI